MYTTYHLFPLLPFKDLIKKDGNPTTPFQLATGTKPSVSHSRVLFCPCVVRKAAAHVGKKALNMRHQVQKGFRGISVGIPQHKKGYLVYLPGTRKIISSCDVIFDESFSSTLAYMSQPYAEAISMRPAVSYTPYAFTHFEEGDLLSETRDNAESGNESDENSTMTPLFSKEEMDALDSGNEYDDEPINTYMLKDNCDGSQSRPSIHRIEARYNICDYIKGSQAECKLLLLSTQNVGKDLHKVFKSVVKDIMQVLLILGESISEVSYFIPETRNFA